MEILLIIGTGFLLYLKTLFFNFTYLDDNVLILDNYHFLKNLANVAQVFVQQVFHILHQQAAYYRPILTLSFMFDAQLGGTSPFIYHLTNIAIHLFASCLLFIFLIKLKYPREPSLFLSLVFVVHPVLTQAVAWIPGRNDSLMTLFILSSFILFLDFLKTKKWKYYFFHLLFFALALFTKESALVLTVIIFIYLHLIIKEKFLSANKKILTLGWSMVVIPWFILRQTALKNPIKMTIVDFGKSIFFNSPVIIQFIGKTVFPFNLSVLPIIQDTTFIYGFIAILFLTAVVFLTKKKRSHPIIFGLLWFILFLLPTLTLHNSAIPFGADYHLEHRLYLPIIGLIIVLLETDLAKKFKPKSKKSLIPAVMIIFIFSMITFIYSNNFKNRLNFWKNAVKTSPHSPLAHRNLGAMYHLEDLLNEAEQEYKKSLELNPLEPMAHNNLGLIYANKGMFEKAEIEYQKEIAINPFYDKVHFNLGLLYYQQEKTEKAIELWEKTIEINPDYSGAYNNLAIHYYQKNNLTKAKFYLQQLQKKGLEVHPGLLKILYSN